MASLVTCNFDDESIKNEDAIVSTTFSPLSVYGENFRRSRVCNSIANRPIWPEIKLVPDFMPVLVICKFEEDPIKTEGAIDRIHNIFSDAQGQVTPKSMDGYGQNSNSSEILCMSWLPASVMKIRSKVKEIA